MGLIHDSLLYSFMSMEIRNPRFEDSCYSYKSFPYFKSKNQHVVYAVRTNLFNSTVLFIYIVSKIVFCIFFVEKSTIIVYNNNKILFPKFGFPNKEWPIGQSTPVFQEHLQHFLLKPFVECLVSLNLE